MHPVDIDSEIGLIIGQLLHQRKRMILQQQLSQLYAFSFGVLCFFTILEYVITAAAYMNSD